MECTVPVEGTYLDLLSRVENLALPVLKSRNFAIITASQRE
jgi:hypothetical protein